MHKEHTATGMKLDGPDYIKPTSSAYPVCILRFNNNAGRIEIAH